MSRGTGYNRRRRVRLREGAGLPYRWWATQKSVRYSVSIDYTTGAGPFWPGRGPSEGARRVPVSTFDELDGDALRRALLDRLPDTVVAEWRLGCGRLTVWLEERAARAEGFLPTGVRRLGRAVSRQKVVCLNPLLSREGWFVTTPEWTPDHVPEWSAAGRLVVVDVAVYGVGVFRVGRATRPSTVARVVGAAVALRLPAYGDPGAELWLRSAQ